MFLLFVFVSIFYCSCPLQVDAVLQGQWSDRHHLYTPREKVATACIDSNVYFVGGQSFTGLNNDLWRWNTTGFFWEELYPYHAIPDVSAAAMASYNGSLYLFGGLLSLTESRESSSLYTLVMRGKREDEMEWKEVYFEPNAPRPAARSRHQMVAVSDGVVVLFGLSQSNFFNDVWHFNPATQQWKELSSGNGASGPSARFDPTCRYQSSSATSSGNYHLIWCFGGTRYEGDSNHIHVFNLTSQRWNSPGELTVTGVPPMSRRLALCFLWEDNFYVYSGWSMNSGNVIDMVLYWLDIQTLSWHNRSIGNSVREKLQPRHSAASLVCGGRPWLFSGSNQTNLFNDMWTLDNSISKRFLLIRNTTAIPPPRAQHQAVVVGTEMFVLLGVERHGEFLTDVWSFDLLVETWTKRAEVTSATDASTESIVEGRADFSALAFGSFIWVFGGTKKDGSITNHLLVFDTVNNTWSIPPMRGQLPEPRSSHAGTVALSHLVFFGGMTQSQPLSNDLLMYSLLEQRWNTVIPAGSASSGGVQSIIPPARKNCGLVFNMDLQEIMIIGGLGSNSALSDRWKFSAPNHSSTAVNTYEVFYVPLNSTFDAKVDPGAEDFLFLRSNAVVVGAASHYFILGGVISQLFPINGTESFYIWDLENGRNTPLQTMPHPVYDAAGIYFGKNIYVFGGTLIMKALKRRNMILSSVQVFSLDSSDMCDQTGITVAPRISSCLACSPGTENPTCRIVPRGYYKPNSYSSSLIPCPKGTQSYLPAAFGPASCEPCHAGTYNNKSGQAKCFPCPRNYTCLIGAQVPIHERRHLPAWTHNVEAAPFHQKTPSYFTEILVGIGSFGVLLIVLIQSCHRWQRHRWKRHFLTAEAIVELKDLFERYASEDGVLDKSRFLQVACELRKLYSSSPTATTALPSKLNLSDSFSNSPLLDDATKEFVKDVLVEFGIYRRQYGTKLLSYPKYVDLITIIVQQGLLPAFCGSPAGEKDYEKHCGPMGCGISRFDFFKVYHRENVGDTQVRRRSDVGGIFFLIFLTAATVFATFLLVKFLYNIEEETRSVLPTIVSEIEPYGDLRIAVQIRTEAADCVERHHQHENHGKKRSEGEEENFIPAAGRCIHKNTVQWDANILLGEGAFANYSCQTQSNAECKLIWRCTNCSVPVIRGNATVEFYFGESNVFSSATFLEISSSTGIRGTRSASYHRFTIDSPHLLYRGYPATSAVASLLPTSYTADESFIRQKKESSTGYHVNFEGENFQEGNFVTARTFSLFTGLPVTLVLVPERTTLFVKLQLTAQLIDFLSALLGGVAGLSGICVLLMNAYEYIIASGTQSKMKKRDQSKVVPQREVLAASMSLTSSRLDQTPLLSESSDVGFTSPLSRRAFSNNSPRSSQPQQHLRVDEIGGEVTGSGKGEQKIQNRIGANVNNKPPPSTLHVQFSEAIEMGDGPPQQSSQHQGNSHNDVIAIDGKRGEKREEISTSTGQEMVARNDHVHNVALDSLGSVMTPPASSSSSRIFGNVPPDNPVDSEMTTQQ